MDRKSVTSSNIQSIGYDNSNEVLEIEFHGGAVYQYFQVPESVYLGLLVAPSHGSFFHDHVRAKYLHKEDFVVLLFGTNHWKGGLMIIESLRVQNYRSILDQTLICEPLTILVGANGAGKSSFLRALALFYAIDARYGRRDFYNDDIERAICITVTFADLTNDERELFGRYVHQDHLIVEKEVKWPPNKENQKYFGTVLQHPDFLEIRGADRAREKISIYNELARSERYRNKLETVRSAVAVDESLRTYEESNQSECERMREPTQFFGATPVGGGRLDHFTLYLLVPAVRDAAEDASEGRGKILTQLMDLVIRTALARSRQVRDLREQTQKDFDEIMDPDQLPQLKELESQLTDNLSLYAPGASVKLAWQEGQKIELPMPEAEIDLVEDNYPSSVERTGHGLQRAFVLTLLQILALAQRANEQEREAGEKEEVEREAKETPHLILAIEEPELYQHPSRQRHLANVLMELSAGAIPGVASRVQVIYSTHSPLLLDIDRTDLIRRLQKDVVSDSLPKQTVVFQAGLEAVAADLETASEAPKGSFSGEGLAARLQAIMNPWVNEGFFADLAVLVEGEDDRAAILGIAKTQGHDLESMGISVIPCRGKPNVGTVAAIFHRFNIPTYLIWDSDHPHPREKENNYRLLRLCDQETEDWPGTISEKFACFKNDLEATVRSELGDTLFEKLIENCKEEYSIPKHKHALKNPAVWQRIIELAHEQRAASPSLQRILENILTLRLGNS